MMDVSDPKIQESSASRRVNERKKRSLPAEVLALLREPNLVGSNETEEDDSDESG